MARSVGGLRHREKGKVIAEAATHPGGRPPAERNAIDQAGQTAAGATLFVTLEPCYHRGKTSPCTDAIIDARISRVVCAVQDPNPRVNGGRFAKLREAGIDVLVGMCRETTQAMISGFFHRVHFGVPELVTLTENTGLLPEGMDGVLVSGKTAVVVLTTRSGTVESELRSLHHQLEWIGSLGLTTVAIPKIDSLWHDLQSHAEVAERDGKTQMAVPPSEVGA